MENHPSKHEVNQALKGADGELTPFAYHMLAIGRLCVTWALLDRYLSDCVAILLDCSAAQAACITTETRDVSERCRLLKTLSYLEAPSKEWRSVFERVLDHISNTLGPKRNRYVHDYWKPTGAALERISRIAKIAKPQAFKEKELTFETTHATPYNEVDDFTARLTVTLSGLHLALIDLRNWRAGRALESPLLLHWETAVRDQSPLPLAPGAPTPPPPPSEG